MFAFIADERSLAKSSKASRFPANAASRALSSAGVIFQPACRNTQQAITRKAAANGLPSRVEVSAAIAQSIANRSKAFGKTARLNCITFAEEPALAAAGATIKAKKVIAPMMAAERIKAILVINAPIRVIT